MMRFVSVLCAGLIMAAVLSAPAPAQKKAPVKKETTTVTTRLGGIKEVLSQFVGKTTSLGVLKRVEGDYFVVEDDGNTSYHPLSTLHTIKLVKDQDTGEITIEIRLTGKD